MKSAPRPDKDDEKHPIERLLEVMARLRDPDGGCPWDLQQNFKTIAPYTIEEAYEVADAIARGDMNDLKEELGDLLFQPVYHAQMAAESGHFNFLDVIETVTNKMIERHPHVFGDQVAQSAADVNAIWDQKKSQEKTHDSVLDSVPKALPALLRSKKLQNRAAKVGFEWTNTDDILDKLSEEITELKEAMQNGSAEDKKEEIGDVLFVLVNFARRNGVDAEGALRDACDKFERRFRGIEDTLKKKGQAFSDVTLREMEDIWTQQKKKEKGRWPL